MTPSGGLAHNGGVGAAEFQACFGEDLGCVLDTSTWTDGENLEAVLDHLRGEVRRAVREEREAAERIRSELFPLLGGPRALSVDDIGRFQQCVLFNGQVEAAEGVSEVHDSLPLTVHQVGVALVSYSGSHRAWQQRLYRRDVRERHGDAVDDLIDLLHRRDLRSEARATDPLSELARRGILAYGERAILLRQGHARWRMGHGSPAPLELLTGNCTDMAIESIRLVREYVERQRRFVFVATDHPSRQLMTVGQGLFPLEYVPFAALADVMHRPLEMWREASTTSVSLDWDGEALSPYQWVARFRDRVASRVQVGVYRATRLSPPRVFYAPEECFDEAAAVALADACLNEKDGVPMLLEAARQACRQHFGGTLAHLADAAYADCGVPYRYRLE